MCKHASMYCMPFDSFILTQSLYCIRLKLFSLPPQSLHLSFISTVQKIHKHIANNVCMYVVTHMGACLYAPTYMGNLWYSCIMTYMTMVMGISISSYSCIKLLAILT